MFAYRAARIISFFFLFYISGNKRTEIKEESKKIEKMEFLEEFLQKLGEVFPEKSKELKSSVESIKTAITNLETTVKKLTEENQELKARNGLSIKKAIIQKDIPLGFG